MLGQEAADSTKRLRLKTLVQVTNNGFSFIPSFSLGKPAVITQLSISGKSRWSFEPEFRYSLEGKPWSFIFIWRYRLIRKDRFKMILGTHLPALNFRQVQPQQAGSQGSYIQVNRFFPVFECSPIWEVHPKIQVNAFYLYGKGVEPDLVQNTHFFAIRSLFSALPIYKKWYANVYPQLFYLRSDQKSGYYTAGNLILGRKGFPFTISATFNKAIKTTISGRSFDWNIGLNHTFDRTFYSR